MASTVEEQQAFIEEQKKRKPREIWLELWELRNKVKNIEPVSTELTPEREVDKEYSAGRTVRLMEYGVLYPNGVLHWNNRFEDEDERQSHIRQWEHDLKRAQVDLANIPYPKFVKRVKQESFTEYLVFA